MSDLVVVDTVPAWTLEVGESIRVGQEDYTIYDKNDSRPDVIEFKCEPLDYTDDYTYLELTPDELVHVLNYDSSEE